MTASPAISRFAALEEEVTQAENRAELFRSPSFGSRFFARLDAAWEGSRGILSLDVFDTLLLRDAKSELRRFWEIGGLMAGALRRIGFGSITAEDALTARYLATLASYRASIRVQGCREGSLTEIHETASAILTGRRDHGRAFAALELEYEAERVTLNPLLISYIRRHHDLGGRTILLTDMYMHGDQVQALLNAAGAPAEGLFDLLLSSADEKVSKASGGLFSLAERKMKAKAAQFLHIGDSLKGDYLQPRKRGWRAVFMPLSNSERHERRRDHAAAAAELAERHGLNFNRIKLPD